MKDLGSDTEEEEEPKQGCADTTCKWLFESEGCTRSSHVNSFPGLPLRGQKGHVCYPTRFSFLGLSTQLQVAVLVASIFSLSCSVECCQKVTATWSYVLSPRGNLQPVTDCQEIQRLAFCLNSCPRLPHGIRLKPIFCWGQILVWLHLIPWPAFLTPFSLAHSFNKSFGHAFLSQVVIAALKGE